MIIPGLYIAVEFPVVQKVSLLHKLMEITQEMALAVNTNKTKKKNKEITKSTN